VLWVIEYMKANLEMGLVVQLFGSFQMRLWPHVASFLFPVRLDLDGSERSPTLRQYKAGGRYLDSRRPRWRADGFYWLL
jgi:hypothetical protein